MKNYLIKLIKKNKYLYSFARKVYYRIWKKPVVKRSNLEEMKYVVYVLKNMDELEKIKEHYSKLKIKDYLLMIIVDNPDYNLNIHELISSESCAIVSADYFRRYYKKLNLKNVIILDYKNVDIANLVDIL